MLTKQVPVKSESTYRFKNFVLQSATLKDKDLFRQFDSSAEGLPDEQARQRLAKTGLNEIDQEKYQWQTQLLKIFLNPFIVLLVILSLVSYFTDDISGSLVMAVMVLVSVCLTFFQEFRSSKAAARLKEMVSTNASVIRRLDVALRNEALSRKVEVPISHLVPGDVIHLSAGDMIPADLRIFSSKDLFISQSALTGESLPVEKFHLPETGSEMLELKNVCYMGTNVVSG
jgi:Mg2+-importing ATPase